jgi:chromosome segregation ATPase
MGIFDRVRDKARTGFYVTKEKVGEATKKAKAKIEGKPEFIDKYTELKKDLEEKNKLLAQLDKSQSSISKEMYQKTRVRYTNEIKTIKSEMKGTEKKATEMKEKCIQEKMDCTLKLKPLQDELKDIEAMHKAGAMDQKEYVSKKSELNREVSGCESRLKKAEKRLSFLGDVISIKQ